MNFFHRTNWKYIAIVVVFGLVVGGGAWWYADSLRVEPHTPQIVTPRPASSPTPSETDISIWQTYRNDEFGFEVRYPEEWFADAEDVTRVILCAPGFYGNLYDSSKIECKKTGTLPVSQVVLIVYTDRTFFSNLSTLEGFSCESIASKTTVIAGLIGVIKECLYNKSDRRGGNVHVFFEKPPYFYYIATFNLGLFQENRKILDQILSTFRFAEK